MSQADTSATASFATSDLCDANEASVASGDIRVLHGLASYGGQTKFSGPITTLRVFEDNSLVRTVLEGSGDGRVLLVDGGGSRRCALLGGNLAELAVRNGWAGIIVDGCVRDVEELQSMKLSVRAIGSCPVKSVKRGNGQREEVVRVCGGVIARPGEWCYGDRDGVILSAQPLLGETAITPPVVRGQQLSSTPL